MTELDRSTLERLIDGAVDDEQLAGEILPDPKDEKRFEQVRDILQDRVEWEDPILVPLNDHLYVVGTDAGRIIRGGCGHEFCDFGGNWKLEGEIRVREGEEAIGELYSEDQASDPDWEYEVREYFCPGCYELVEVEAVPRGYPILQKFEPDVDAFYEEWLGETPPDAVAD